MTSTQSLTHKPKENLPRFQYQILNREDRATPPTIDDAIQFGKVHSDHMLGCDYIAERGGWQDIEIKPFAPFLMTPHSIAFHYGQQVFEGMKCYRNSANPDQIYLFRPELNAERMRRSAERLGMQPVPVELFLDGLNHLLAIDSDWVLPHPGSLYVRPTLIGIDEGIVYKASHNYRFFVFLCPVKAYYANTEGTTVFIEREKVRAVKGGVGDAKCSGNYAPPLTTMAKAVNQGADQVLWLDAIEHRYIEEVGTSNVMFVYGDKIVTPPLSGSILPGITRRSVIELAKYLGYSVEEKPLAIDEVLTDIETGKITEAFGTGTAVVISPLVGLIDEDKKYIINDKKIGSVTIKLKETLVAIQNGSGEDPFDWRREVQYAPVIHTLREQGLKV